VTSLQSIDSVDNGGPTTLNSSDRSRATRFETQRIQVDLGATESVPRGIQSRILTMLDVILGASKRRIRIILRR
jgi:hypothetical protein